ncbi:protein FAM185A isoform X2 [Ambystoma mexicanum]|uniref:protein FAM185A isoform X2 n=1 Tax=Ambystoma mexicanum TaxID=8296 RepID=UPI0037E72012
MAPLVSLLSARMCPVQLLLRWPTSQPWRCSPQEVPCRRHTVSHKHPILKQWTLVVCPFSSLRVEVPCHVRVRTQDPLAYPNQDRVFVTISGAPRLQPHGPGLEDLEVKYKEAAKRLSILSERIDSQMRVEVSTPARFDLDIKTFGAGSVKIQKIDCDTCRIETEKGDSALQSVKSHHIHVRARGGKVVGIGTLHGNLDIQASEKSTVFLDKVQGSSVHISTEDGQLRTKYIYAESSFLSTAAGNIGLGSVHDSLDGSLKALTQQGAINVYINQLGKVALKSQEGDIAVKVPASLKASLDFSGTEIDVNPEIQLQGTQNTSKEGHASLTAQMNERSDGEQWIHASTDTGRVSLQIQNWFQSLKLQTS